MTIVYTKLINTDDKAELLLDENTSFLYIFYNGNCISELKDNTWSTIKDDGDWVFDALISFAVADYTKSISSDFNDAIAELD